MCAALEGATDTCVISFIDLYEKVKRNSPGFVPSPRQTGCSWAGRWPPSPRGTTSA